MKLQSTNTGKIFYFLTFALVPVLVLAIFSKEYRVYDYVFNPDSLYFSSLYQGLFVEGYPFKTFWLNPSILLIPDAAIYFTTMAITGDTIITTFIFGILQHLLIFIGILLIFRKLFSEDSWLLAGFAGFMMMMFLLGAILSNDIIFAAFALVSTNHVGAFVMMLFTLTLSLSYLNRPKIPTLVWIFILSMLSVFSDRIFILMYSLPILFVLTLQYINNKNRASLILSLSIILSTSLGVLLQNFVDGRFLYLSPTPDVISFVNILPAFKTMMADLAGFILALNTYTIIILLSLLSWILQFFISIKLIRKGDFKSPLSFYILFSVIYIQIIFWMPVVTGTYIAKHILRYNISAFYLSMINIPIIIYYFSSLRFNKKVITGLLKITCLVLFIVFMAIGTSHLSRSGIRNFFNYYPEFVKEIDEIATQENLLNGVGHFWISKPITTFSKNEVKIYHSWPNFVPYFHVNSRMSYTGAGQIFNFAVISSFDDKNAYRKYLDVEGRTVKNGNTEVLILPPFRFDNVTGLPYLVRVHKVSSFLILPARPLSPPPGRRGWPKGEIPHCQGAGWFFRQMAES